MDVEFSTYDYEVCRLLVETRCISFIEEWKITLSSLLQQRPSLDLLVTFPFVNELPFTFPTHSHFLIFLK
jgi:hypothetical protein